MKVEIYPAETWHGSESHDASGLRADVPDGEVACRQCPSGIIETPDDLANVRDCEVIDGDLVFDATALERVTAGDLPILRRVRGSLIAAGAPPLRELTLPVLREVGSDPDDLLEMGLRRAASSASRCPSCESCKAA